MIEYFLSIVNETAKQKFIELGLSIERKIDASSEKEARAIAQSQFETELVSNEAYSMKIPESKSQVISEYLQIWEDEELTKLISTT